MLATKLVLVTVLGTLFAAIAQGCDGAIEEPSQPAHATPNFTGIWILPGDSGERTPEPEFTPEYQAKHEANQALSADAESGKSPDSYIVRRMGGGCVPYGMPRSMGIQDSLDIVQVKERILVMGENGENRRIWLDREQLPLDELADMGFFGRSVGKWEGDVLVVNTIGIDPKLEGENLMPHSEQMIVTERLYLKDGLLIDDVTITDPAALKKPWTFTYKRKRADRDYEPLEWVCDPRHYRVDKDGRSIVE